MNLCWNQTGKVGFDGLEGTVRVEAAEKTELARKVHEMFTFEASNKSVFENLLGEQSNMASIRF